MTRAVFRFIPFEIKQDPTAWPEYEAVCVSGDDQECGETSGVHTDTAPVEEFQRKHTQANPTHRRYRRTFYDYAVLQPTDGPELEPVAATGSL